MKPIMSRLAFNRGMATETTPEWTDEHEEQYQRQRKRLDVETAVFDHDAQWEAR